MKVEDVIPENGGWVRMGETVLFAGDITEVVLEDAFKPWVKKVIAGVIYLLVVVLGGYIGVLEELVAAAIVIAVGVPLAKLFMLGIFGVVD